VIHESSRNERAEFAVLGAMLLGDEPVSEAIELLTPADFAWRQNRVVFEAMQSLFEKSAPVDGVSLISELQARGALEEAGGAPYVADLIGGVPTGDSVWYHCKLVKEAAARRALGNACQTAIRDLQEEGGAPVDEILEKTEKSIFDIAHNVTPGKPELLTSFLPELVERIEARRSSGKEIFGVESGFKLLDHMTGGLHAGELTILAARPSMGKTALATNILDFVGTTLELPAVLFSLEMSREDIGHRIMSLKTGIPMNELRSPRMRSDDTLQIARQMKLMAESKVVIDAEPGASILAMRAKARRAMVQYDFKLLVIDYLQLMHSPRRSDNRNEEIGYVSRGLKALARELNVPVLAVSQLNRGPEQRPDKRPMLSDLRESGSIEQDADVVMFLYRPEYYFGKQDRDGNDLEGKTELHLAKNRNGPTGVINMTFRDKTMKFYEMHRD